MFHRLLRIATLWLALTAPALAAQNTYVTPGAPLPMATLKSFLDGALAAVGTCNSGTSAPSVGPAGAPVAQQCWWNTSVTPWQLGWYDGTQWVGSLKLNPSTHVFGAAFTDSVSINTLAATTTQALSITQSSPTNGTTSGTPVFGSLITYNDQGIVANGTGLDAFGQINSQVNGVRIDYEVTGNDGGGTSHSGLSVAAKMTANNGGTFGFGGGVYTNSNVSTTTAWGALSYITVDASGTLKTGIAFDAELAIASGAALQNRVAFSANSSGPTQGSVLDAAFVADTIVNPVSGFTGTPAPFKKLIALSANLQGSSQFPLDSTGDFFYSDASGTVANFANLSNVSVTGYIINFPGVQIPGQSNANTLAASFSKSLNNGFTVNVTNGSGGVSELAGFAAGNVSNTATFGIGGTAYTGALILQNRAFVNASAGAAGIAINNAGANPIIFGVSNTEVGRFTASGLSLSSALPVGSGGTNCTSASGTCLDNISGFGSTGLLQRTGAGAYAAVTYTSAGSWTPADASGAGLTFTAVSASYTQIGNMIHAYFTLTYPTTASGSAASISGLPVTVANANYALAPASCYTNANIGFSVTAFYTVNSTTFGFANQESAANVSNANLSGKIVRCMLIYPAS